LFLFNASYAPATEKPSFDAIPCNISKKSSFEPVIISSDETF